MSSATLRRRTLPLSRRARYHATFVTAIALLMLDVTPLVAASPQAVYNDLGTGTVGYVVMSSGDITADGSIVVGTGLYPGLPFPQPEAIRWTAETGCVGLGHLPDCRFWSFGLGVSDDGAVVVGVAMGPEALFRPFRWTAATGMRELPFAPGTPEGSFGLASGISRDGTTIVGHGGFQEPVFVAQVWQSGNESPTTLHGSIATAISDDQLAIAGSDFDGNVAYYPYQSWIWRAGQGVTALTPIAGTTGYSQATAISGDGLVVVGEYESGQDPDTGEPVVRAMRWTEAGGMQDLGDPAGFSPVRWSSAEDTNVDGSVIVGSYGYADGILDQRAFIWTLADGMHDLQTLLAARYGLTLPGIVLTRCGAVTPNGHWLAGDVFDPTAERTLFRVHLIDYATGDIDCDGDVDLFDVDPFVAALGGFASYQAAFPLCDYTNADADHDGDVDFFDIDPFVACLSGQCL